jgi:hypothetical protein
LDRRNYHYCLSRRGQAKLQMVAHRWSRHLHSTFRIPRADRWKFDL